MPSRAEPADVWIGTQQGSVCEALAALDPLLNEDDEIVIRTIDSGPAAPALDFHRVPHYERPDGACISVKWMRARRVELFTGFDAVCIRLRGGGRDIAGGEWWPGASSIAWREESAGFRPSALDFLLRSQTRVALSDGCDLNFATTERQIADALAS